jgi:hypothetical protein
LPKRSYAVGIHLLKNFWMTGVGTTPARTTRRSPSLPVPRWNDSSFSIGPRLRASGANPEWLSIWSWTLPSRSMNCV